MSRFERTLRKNGRATKNGKVYTVRKVQTPQGIAWEATAPNGESGLYYTKNEAVPWLVELAEPGTTEGRW